MGWTNSELHSAYMVFTVRPGQMDAGGLLIVDRAQTPGMSTLTCMPEPFPSEHSSLWRLPCRQPTDAVETTLSAWVTCSAEQLNLTWSTFGFCRTSTPLDENLVVQLPFCLDEKWMESLSSDTLRLHDSHAACPRRGGVGNLIQNMVWNLHILPDGTPASEIHCNRARTRFFRWVRKRQYCHYSHP